MHLEIEAKAYVRNIKKIEKTLIEIGAQYQATYHQIDSYYNHPSRDFAKTDEAIRIRNTATESFLTYKGPKLDTLTKTREEVELSIDNPETGRTILERLGFRFITQVKKQRAVYTYEHFRICLDEVEDLGHFVEVEIQEEDVEKGKSKILDFLRELDMEELETRSYLELLLEKNGCS